MVADRLDDSSLGPATRPGAEPRARSPSLAGRVAATVRGLASGGGLRPPSTSRGDGDDHGDDAGELQESEWWEVVERGGDKRSGGDMEK